MKILFYRLRKTTKLILSVPSTPILYSPIHTIHAVNPMKIKKLFSQRIVMLLCLMLVSFWGWGQTNQTFLSTSTWTAPAGVTSISVECWGGGGGGGNTSHNGNQISRGGGGAGGAYAKKATLSVVPGTTYTVTVGTGGTGGTAGTDSWFDTVLIIIAKGGVAGNNGSRSDGTGGLGTTTGSIGDAGVVFAGGNGGNASTSGSGGGGGGAGSTGTGNSASNNTQGSAKANNGGAGGAGITGSGLVDGNPGSIYGAGGSGSISINNPGTARTGGTGANGLVTVTYTCPTYSINTSTTMTSPICTANTTTVTVTSLTANLPNGSYTVTYNLTGGNTATGSTAAMSVSGGVGTFLTSTLTNATGSPVTTTITITNISFGSSAGCSSAISANNTATVTVNPVIAGNTSGIAVSICNNTTTTLTSGTATGGSGTYTYLWESSNALGGTYAAAAGTNNTANYTTATLTTASTQVFFRRTVTSGGCTDVATGVQVTVNPNLPASVSITITSGAQTICAGTSVTFTATPTNGGTTPAYQWKVNGVNAGTNSATFTTTTLANSDAVTVILTSNATPCLTSSPGTSNSISMTVNPTNTVGVASSTPTLCFNTALAEITHATTGATGIGTATGLPAGVAATFASSTISISGTPTTSGTFNYSIPLTGGCGSVNATGTITVSPPSAGGTVVGSTTVCSGTNSATLTLSGHIGTIIRWELSLDNFATAGTPIANTTTTLKASDLTATTYYRAVVTSGVCASAYSTVATVTVNSCINKWKGSVSTDWNTPGNWTLNLVPAVDANLVFDDSPVNDCYLDQNRSVTNITNSQGVYGVVLNGNKLTLKGNLLFSGAATIDASASNSTMQFSGSAVQSISIGVFKNAAVYNLDVTNSNNVILSGNLRLLNTFTATTGLLDAFTNSPTVTYAGDTVQTIVGNQFLGGKIENLTIDNAIAVNLNTNFTITNTLVINIGKKLSVSSLYQLTALGTISNNGGTSGLILKSDPIGTASLIHNTNNVPATVQRYISGPTEGWHFLSSPVSSQSFSGSWLPLGTYGNGTGYDLYLWDEPSFSFKYKLDTSSIGWNSVHPGSNFSVGRGYLYSVQATNPTKEFIGNLNNGPVNYPITFTETLDPKLIALKGFNLVGNPYPSSIDWQATSGWDRSKLEVSSGGSDMWVWNPTANNYGVFNSASGVGTNSINRYLAPMQGYFVKAAATGNLAFDNRVRSHTGAGNWFKNTGIKNPVIRIAVESEDGNGADEALLQFGYADSNQGTSKLFSHVSKAPSLYLSLEDEKYSVRYLTNTAENNAVPMEFKAGKEGVYKLLFNYDSKELDFIQLEDRLLKTSTLIKPLSSYLFKSSKEESVSRFVLHFVAAENTTKNVLNGSVYMDGSQIAVDLKGINGQTEIKLFDTAGKLILQKYLEGNGLTKLDLNLATQILLVRLTNTKGTSSTKVLFSPLKQ
jgi:hypothetical protein